MLQDVLKIIDTNQEQSIRDLKTFLSIPSISTDPAHAPDIDRCAQFLIQRLQGIGYAARLAPTQGLPAVIAKNHHRPGRPTILFYGHYDVQPPDPLSEWHSPPFEPTIRDGSIYARGASDDKGQVWAHLQALAAWEQAGGLPVNITLLLEGEEEIGSMHLAPFVQEHREELAADLAVISDTAQFAPGVPAITYATRGLVYLDFQATGPSVDLHSGVYGGAVPNPANILVQLLATLQTADGRVNVPGFYDDVAALGDEDRHAWKNLPWDDAVFAAAAGLKPQQLQGEAGYSTLERIWARPTCDINGLTAGYQGPGAKTVIGSTAAAKVSFRLVPNQDPDRIADLLVRTLRERCDPSVKLEIHVHSRAEPGMVPRDSRAVQLASEAIQIGFGVKPALIRGGGTLPIITMLSSELQLDALLVGFSLPDDGVHGPNEKFSLHALHHGTRTAAALYDLLRQVPRA